jgi:hypothetical protein
MSKSPDALQLSKMQCIPTNEYAGSANLTWRSGSLCFELTLTVRLNTPLLLLRSCREEVTCVSLHTRLHQHVETHFFKRKGIQASFLHNKKAKRTNPDRTPAVYFRCSRGSKPPSTGNQSAQDVRFHLAEHIDVLKGLRLRGN